MLQSSEKEAVSYSETSRKRGLNSSLTYWKLKTKEVKNMISRLISSSLGCITTY
jgi:hypothetical protein